MFKNFFPRLFLTMESDGGFLFHFMETAMSCMFGQVINFWSCKNFVSNSFEWLHILNYDIIDSLFFIN